MEGERGLAHWWTACVLVLSVVLGIIEFATWGNWHHDHNKVVHTYERAVAQNHFWEMLDGKEPPTADPAGRLAADLRPFVASTTITTNFPSDPLVPRKMSELLIPLTYNGFSSETGLCVAGVGQDSNGHPVCSDSGVFNSVFLQDFDLLRAGHLDELLQHPTTPKDDPFTWWPAHQRNPLAVLPLAYLAISLFGLLTGAVALRLWSSTYSEKGDWGRWPNLTLNGEYTEAKLWLLALNPHVSIPRMILLRTPKNVWNAAGGYFDERRAAVLSQRKQDADAAALRKSTAEQTQRMDASGIAEQWRKAKSNLGTLDALGCPADQKSAKEWKWIRKDTEELIAELEAFPDRLSDRAKVLLARQVERDNQGLRDVPEALMAAHDEIDNI